MEKIVITVDGTEEVRANCRRISGSFYRIGDPKIKDSGQCYLVNGKYCRAETGYIVYDHTIGEYVTKNDSLVEGVVGVEGDKLEFGYFQTPRYPIKLIDVNSNEHVLFNEEIVAGSRVYRYYMERDAYVHYTLVTASKFNKLKKVSSNYKNSLSYDSRPVMDSYTKAYNENELVISKKVRNIAPYLQDLTFGIEFETCQGVVPDRCTAPLGLIPLRDGSVAGLEYATIPYQGEKGLQATVESCKVLSKFTKTDENCSLHLHIGGVPRTEEFFLALFKTLCLVQDEMFDMFPLYKKYNFGVKRKNYTQPFSAARLLSSMDGIIDDKNIKANFGVLYEFLSAGQSYSEVGKDLANVISHPSDPHGSRKWNIKSRYYWVNLIPLLFGNKKTVEFRIHTPTTDPDKVIYYLLYCASIINYVKKNTKSILSSRSTGYADISNMLLSEMRGAPGALIDNLLRYMNRRKQIVAMNNHTGNIRGDETKIKVSPYFGEKTDVNPINNIPPPAQTDRRGRIIGGPREGLPAWAANALNGDLGGREVPREVVDDNNVQW